MILVTKAQTHRQNVAIIDKTGTYTYQDLLDQSSSICQQLLNIQQDYHNTPIAFLAPPSVDYVAVQWGIWRAGGIAVPISVSHPVAEIEYIFEDTQSKIVFVHPDFLEKIKLTKSYDALHVIKVETDHTPHRSSSEMCPPNILPNTPALMIYTSGTTSRPKGVVMTHANIEAQIRNLVSIWKWTSTDHILNVLPLHHVHGLINIVCCALYVGATCEMHDKFSPELVWQNFVSQKTTLFMAVPTIYNRLILFWEKADPETQKRLSEAVRKLRLMVSGSASLPVVMLHKWKEISAHTLLERYGMTEIGMALSNPLEGERLAGFVGRPLPNFKVRLIDEQSCVIEKSFQSGEIQVKSPTIFQEYWNKPKSTKSAFTEDGWFMTGDIAERDVEGNYKILGRKSQDIIKTGGFKVSALEIESVLLTFHEIEECAVVSSPDEDLGEIITVFFVSNTSNLDANTLRENLKVKLAHYKVPSRWHQVNALPRNAMGKIQKNKLKTFFTQKSRNH